MFKIRFLTLIPFIITLNILSQEIIIGTQENYNFEVENRNFFIVRVLFKKEDNKWFSYKHDFNTPKLLNKSYTFFPKTMKWYIGFNGNLLDTLNTKVLTDIKYYYQIGFHNIADTSEILKIGKKSKFYSGWLYPWETYRPLVLNSKPFFTDPDKWEPYEPDSTDIHYSLECLKEEYNASDSILSKAKVEINKSYRSYNYKRKLISLSIENVNIVDHVSLIEQTGEYYYPESEAWIYLNGSNIRYLHSEMRFLNAGDYDNDGNSEVIFKVQQYNYDCYILFYNDFKNYVEFGWHYH